MLTATHDWVHLFEGETAGDVIGALPDILRTRRWFGGKAGRIEAVRILDSIPIPCDSPTVLLLIRVEYEDGGMEIYTLPVTAAFGEASERIRREFPQAVIASLAVQTNRTEQSGLLYDALWNRDLALALLHAIGQESRFIGMAGSIMASSTNAFTDLVPAGSQLEPVVMRAEQSNTSVAYDGRVILKLYRRLGQGMNPDLEIGRVLTRMRFPYVPSIAGRSNIGTIRATWSRSEWCRNSWLTTAMRGGPALRPSGNSSIGSPKNIDWTNDLLTRPLGFSTWHGRSIPLWPGT